MKPSRPLRVLHLINHLGVGGAEMALVNLVNAFDPNVLEAWVGGLFSLGPLTGRLRLSGERISDFRFRAPRYETDLPAMARLIRFIRNQRFDVVHTHLPQSNTAGRLAAWLAGTPVIVATEHNTYFMKSRAAVLMDRVLSFASARLVAVSGAVREFASQQAGIPVDRFVIIPNGIEIDVMPRLDGSQRRAKKAVFGFDAQAAVCLTVGRLVPQKGIDVLIESADRVRRRFPKAVFVVAGGGQGEGGLRARIAEEGLEGCVHLLGPRSDVHELMEISDILVMPSRWEGLPVAMLEACAHGLPVVASRVGGIPEVIESGITGLLVEPDDPAALAGGILTLLKDPTMRQALGAAARDRVVERFDARRVASRMGELYFDLLSRRGPVA
jgi:glycosyltransferase involved in cell wall biosynthesis